MNVTIEMLTLCKKLLFVLLYFLGVWFMFCNGFNRVDDMHSSIPALQKVLNCEKHLLGDLASYIAETETIINFMKSFLVDLKDKKHFEMVKNGSLGEIVDPLNFVLLRKRLSTKLENSENYVKEMATKNIENITAKQYNLPTLRDLEGVTLGLLRVQEIYDIPTEQIANGTIKDINFGAKFTVSDCFEISSALIYFKAYYYATEWLKVGIKLMEEEGWKGITPQKDISVILDFLAYSQYMEGSIENAKNAVETAMSALSYGYTKPNSARIALSLNGYIENYIALKDGTKKPTALNPPVGAFTRHNLTELDLLKKSCRGQLIKTPAEQRKLFCKYERKNHPFLLLAPIKVEVLNLNPLLTVFHEIIYDSEIEILKELSTGKLHRAGVFIHNTSEVSLTRTSKLVWIPNYAHPLMPILSQRVSDMTGLSMETSEEFQLMNYGIGGHYDIHADYFAESTGKNDSRPYEYYDWGNRIATVLFYMSDVSQGGGTSWPNIKVLTLPKKGSAAFWYNLHADGEQNYLSRHSACPTIIGSKWVMNKWIRIRGQEFRRPCLTYPDSKGVNS